MHITNFFANGFGALNFSLDGSTFRAGDISSVDVRVLSGVFVCRCFAENEIVDSRERGLSNPGQSISNISFVY